MAPVSLPGASISGASSVQGALISGACSLQSALASGACSLQGALTSPCARGAFHPTHGAPCAFSTKSQLPQGRGVPKETLQSSSSRSCERPLSTSSPTARAARPARHHKTDDARCASRSAQRTKPHTNTPPTAHSQRSARHLHRDPSSSYFQRSASAHIATSPNATKLRRTAVQAARSHLSKAQLDTTRISSKRPPGRPATWPDARYGRGRSRSILQ